MSQDNNILKKLQKQRADNIAKLLDWSEPDFKEMSETYMHAREIALEANDQESIAILDEKLSQLNEAHLVKSNRTSDIQA